MQNLRTQLIFIFILVLAGLYVALPLENKPRIPVLADAKMEMGIDLAGGAELTYRALYTAADSGRKETTQKIVYVLQNRINKRGLKEPRITSAGDEMIQIQMAGIDEDVLKDYKKLIEGVGNLELKEVADKETMKRFNENGVVPDGYEVKDHRDHRPDHNITGKVLLKKQPIVTGSDVADAHKEPHIGPMGGASWVVAFELRTEGAKRFDDAAARLFKAEDSPENGLISIMLDGEIQSLPAVNTAKFNGRGIITGQRTQDEANDLAIILKSGSLPVPIGRRITITNPDGSKTVKDEPKVPEAENFVGPSLGQDSIRRGMIASAISLALVIVFMVAIYRTAGVISVLGLIMNIVWLMAIMAGMGATLTLPGIAGIVLTMGMAVDANILIYERVREELDRGRSSAQAFEAGYERAFVTIVDSNLTTLLAGVVLYMFGTGAIQGFAVTLSLGIITTLISVLWGCKVVLRMMVASGTLTEWKMVRIFKTTNFNFTGLIRMLVPISSAATILLMGLFLWRGSSQYDIDFTGGSVVNFAFADTVNIDEVRGAARAYETPEKVKALADAQVQTIVDPGTDIKTIKLFVGQKARQFQLRTQSQDIAAVRRSVQEAFTPPAWKGPALSHEPFVDVDPKSIPENDRWSAPKEGGDGSPGGGWWVYFRDDGKFDLAAVTKKLSERFKASKTLSLTRDVNDEPIFGGDDAAGTLVKSPDSQPGLAKVKILITKADAASASTDNLRKLRDEIKLAATEDKTFTLSVDPFSFASQIGPTVAAELMNSTFWALVFSWIGMILYVAFRFHQTAFGLAGVVALIHAAFVAIGVNSLAGLIIPKSWGMNFDFNMSTVAAILTIIGYSINDTIVVFDRIRENLATRKEGTFKEIIDLSINQTLSRTVLTGCSVWFACLVLYLFTMTSSGGIASFAFPMLIGVIAGTYSSIFIASPLLLYWFKGRRPQLA